MRCPPRRGAAAIALACVLAAAVPAAGAVQDDEAAVRLAIVAAVRARMGAGAAVRLEQVRVDLDAGAAPAGLIASPGPGSRAGRVVRFTLAVPNAAGGRPAMRRVGQAAAEVHVAVEHVRAAHAVARGVTLGPDDVVAAGGEIGVAPLAPLPSGADAAGARAVRDLAPGEVLTPALLRTVPLVRSGQIVKAVARVGNVEAAGRAVAQQSGGRHDRIRLINPESKRVLEGRVTGAGEVEVLHAY